MSYLALATWGFSLNGVQKAAELLSKDGMAMEAAILTARTVEDDPTVDSVGYGAIPNRDGNLELDAAVMDGNTLKIGAIAGVKGFKNPSLIAGELYKQKNLNFLAASGAEEFALFHGFRREMLVTTESIKAYEKMKRTEHDSLKAYAGHDTVGSIAIDKTGNVCVCTSTSGIYMKHPGRVGDSPLPGCGFYVDSNVGGAVATGVGEDIMKGCICFHIVELMRLGAHPYDAACEAVYTLHKRLAVYSEKVGNIAVICVDKNRRVAGVANHDSFAYTVADDENQPRIVEVERLNLD